MGSTLGELRQDVPLPVDADTEFTVLPMNPIAFWKPKGESHGISKDGRLWSRPCRRAESLPAHSCHKGPLMPRVARQKSGHEPRICRTCGLPFEWRKKWSRDWENVRYCSSRCRRDADKS